MELNSQTLIKNSSKKIFAVYASSGLFAMIMESSAIFIDGLFVANFVSPEAFSSIGVVWPITALLFGLYVMFTMGAIAIAGKFVGENKIRRANLIFTQTVISIFSVSSILLSLIYIFRKKLLPILGAHDNIYNLSLDYINGVLFATFFWGFSYVFSQFIRLNGSPRVSSLMFMTSSITNIVLDFVFIVVLKLGIFGAGLATAIGYSLSFLIGLIYFLRPNCRIKFIKLYGHWNYMLKAIVNGVSEFLSNISAGIIAWLFNITAYKILGNNGILIFSVVNYTITFFIMISTDIGEILSSLVSVSYGAKYKNKMKEFLRMAITLISSISILASSILLIKPTILANILLKNIDAKTIENVVFFVRASIPIFICVGINIIMSAYYTAVQKAGASAMVAALRGSILPILLILTLPNMFGFLGLVLVLPISEIITLIAAVSFYRNRKPDILLA